MVPSEKTNTYERGTYYFFDVQNWRSVISSFTGRRISLSLSPPSEDSLVHSSTFCNFRKVSKEFHLDYDKLEDRPSLPSQNGAATSGNAPGNSRYVFQCSRSMMGWNMNNTKLTETVTSWPKPTGPISRISYCTQGWTADLDTANL